MTKQTTNQIPGDLQLRLAQEDKARGFPAGTMASLMQQEIGGQFDKYLGDPSLPHYQPDANGQRKSSAFGPFGILESTGAKPGYGVAPLKSKDLDEQIRFAGDYLAARSKAAGGLEAGLAGYGEGTPYAQQVMGRVNGAGATGGGGSAPAPAQVAVLDAPVLAATKIDPGLAPLPQLAQAAPTGPDTWQTFLAGMQQGAPRQPVNVNDLKYGQPAPAMEVPQYQFNTAAVAPGKVDFRSFGSWGRKA